MSGRIQPWPPFWAFQAGRLLNSDQPFHPEQQEGEIYAGNMTWEAYKEAGWNYKREGEQAYDLAGKLIPDHEDYDNYRPVFFLASELAEKTDIFAKWSAQREPARPRVFGIFGPLNLKGRWLDDNED